MSYKIINKNTAQESFENDMLIVHTKHKNSEAPYGQGASVRCHVQPSSSSDLAAFIL